MQFWFKGFVSEKRKYFVFFGMHNQGYYSID